MILKGNTRANGSDLATHLLNSYDNERIELAEMRGTIADDLHGGFAEIEAIAAGTRATKPFYSLSINPGEPLTREQYFEAIDAIETRLGLTGQPRAVLFHVKDGREHAHAVWSRIDGVQMQAVHMAHDRRKLCDMACRLADKFGHELPDGLKAWRDKTGFEKQALEPSFADAAMQARTGTSPEDRRAEISALYQASDSAAAFRQALEEKGYVLAKGDRRAFVVVDRQGNVHSLSRYLKGVNRKELQARMAGIDVNGLPSVDQAKQEALARAAAAEDRAREQRTREQAEKARDQQAQREREAAQQRTDLSGDHARRRAELRQEEQELLTLQQSERLVLHAAQDTEAGGLLFRVRSAVSDLIERTPGLRSVLSHITARTGLDPRERHTLERDALSRRHDREKQAMAGRSRALEKIEQRERNSLERDLRRENALALIAERALMQQQQQGWRATDPRLLEDDGLATAFNAAAQGADDGDDGDDTRTAKKSWKARADGFGSRRSRKRGFGHRRDDE
ncbi:MAG: relaxase [Rhodospirillaceae bacterium]|nr:relaxase [Rhodospirillaceae bacterium]